MGDYLNCSFTQPLITDPSIFDDCFDLIPCKLEFSPQSADGINKDEHGLTKTAKNSQSRNSPVERESIHRRQRKPNSNTGSLRVVQNRRAQRKRAVGQSSSCNGMISEAAYTTPTGSDVYQTEEQRNTNPSDRFGITSLVETVPTEFTKQLPVQDIAADNQTTIPNVPHGLKRLRLSPYGNVERSLGIKDDGDSQRGESAAESFLRPTTAELHCETTSNRANADSSVSSNAGTPDAINGNSKRVLGACIEKHDREYSTFSDTNEFEPHEIVAVPRSQERLHYGKIYQFSTDSNKRMIIHVIVGTNSLGVPLTKTLPTILIGKLPSLPIKDSAVNRRAKKIILTIENLYTFMRSDLVSMIAPQMSLPMTPQKSEKSFHTDNNNRLEKDQPQQSNENKSEQPRNDASSIALRSSALCEHSLFLLVHHARRLYYCFKIYENQIQEYSNNNTVECNSKNDKLSTASAAVIYAMEINHMRELSAKLQKRVDILEIENNRLKETMMEKQNVAVEQDHDVEQRHREAIRQKDEAIRKMEKLLRDKDRFHTQATEDLREKVDELFGASLKLS